MSGKMQAELEFLDGDRVGEIVRLESGRTVIGRQVGDLLIDDKEISSIHAIISFERGGWYVMDLGSTNGVFVDEQVKLEARLTSGVVLRFGQTTTTFRFHGEEAGTFANEPPGVADQGVTADSELGTLPRIEVGSTVRSEASAGVKEAATASTQRTPTLPKEGAALLAGKEGAALLAGIATAPSVEVSLEILEGADSGAVRKFKQESVLIGRLNTDLVVRDSDVSRRHTIIEVFDGSQIYLRDLNSTNGTFVNGRRVSSVRLRNGDQVRLGRCLLRFSARPL
jgi:pSer/pThr/pTyr-binding forkhead associated (FHA) protein